MLRHIKVTSIQYDRMLASSSPASTALDHGVNLRVMEFPTAVGDLVLLEGTTFSPVTKWDYDHKVNEFVRLVQIDLEGGE